MKNIIFSYAITALIVSFIAIFSIDTEEVQARVLSYHAVEVPCPEEDPRDSVIRCRHGGSGCEAGDQFFCDEPPTDPGEN